MPAPIQTPDAILSYWFGDDPSDPETAGRQKKVWWGHGQETDDLIRDRFGATLQAAAAGEPESWADTPRGRVALVIVLDQFSRNAHRDTPRMYAQDPAAVAHVRAALSAGEDEQLAFFERIFLLMPLMHAEDMASQDECCTRFQALADAHDDPLKERALGFHGFAVKHRAIVERWGRFPHRNEIVGRDTTPEEAEFLKGPGSSF
jgi:uncharacterized protein (DUF924 family)